MQKNDKDTMLGCSTVTALVAAVLVGVCQTNQYADQCTDLFLTSTTAFNEFAEQYEAWQVSIALCACYIFVFVFDCLPLLFLYSCPLIHPLLFLKQKYTHAHTLFWVMQVALMSMGAFAVARWVVVFLLGDDRPWVTRLKLWVFRTARRIPFVRNKIKSEVEQALVGIEKDFFEPLQGWQGHTQLPRNGIKTDQLVGMLEHLRSVGAPDKRHAEGKVSGTIYVGGKHYKEYSELMTHTYGMFAWTNPLHAGVFPGVRQMEAEIVRMCTTLFGGGEDACGTHTSGGTESIILALRAYKVYYGNKKGITKPNIVAPRTAHPAFDKGCEYFGISLRKIDEVAATRKADVRAMARHIDSNTIAIVGSCPQYPHGAVDPIEDLAQLARKHDIGLHVDCCLGSFVVPFMRDLGYTDFPAFDFRVPGVTSISADTHKFGCAPKGSSVVMFAHADLRRAHYAVYPDWPGGVYGTPTVAGSRPGALIAATWTALMHNGYSGYLENARCIMKTAEVIAAGIENIHGIKLVCRPEGPIVAWTSDHFDVNRMLTGLVHEKGWDLNVLQFPPSIHLCVTMAHSAPGLAQRFLDDLAAVTAELMKSPDDKVGGGSRGGGAG